MLNFLPPVLKGFLILRKPHFFRLLLSERGDSSYISSFVYILVAVVLIAFILNVFHIISVAKPFLLSDGRTL